MLVISLELLLIGESWFLGLRELTSNWEHGNSMPKQTLFIYLFIFNIET